MRNIDSKSRPRTQFRFKYLAVRVRLLRLGGSLTTFSTVSIKSRHQRAHQAIRRHIEDNNSKKFVRTQVYNVANRNVATMAAIRLLLRDKTLPIRVATNTKMAETLMFGQFKYDQSMDMFCLRFVIVEEGALQSNLVAARSSSIDEGANDGSFSARSTS